jgi:hypothetical protein
MRELPIRSCLPVGIFGTEYSHAQSTAQTQVRIYARRPPIIWFGAVWPQHGEKAQKLNQGSYRESGSVELCMSAK